MYRRRNTVKVSERREEVIMASILEYDQAAHEAAIREDGYEEGRKEGRDEERVNTEAERKRADAAMTELERYKKKYGELAET